MAGTDVGNVVGERVTLRWKPRIPFAHVLVADPWQMRPERRLPIGADMRIDAGAQRYDCDADIFAEGVDAALHIVLRHKDGAAIRPGFIVWAGMIDRLRKDQCVELQLGLDADLAQSSASVLNGATFFGFFMASSVLFFT
jgi:hypothetical protein